MKRKKWSELEERTLLTKYADLLTSGTLSKLKTREKKFRPVADHVNFVHHLQDPVNFPFKWSWRDVSIKVQNMRHQYLGVKQKIRISKDEFNWKDGENHWENFVKYKEVFGDVELEVKSKKLSDSHRGELFKDCGDLGFGIHSEDLDEEEEEDGEDDGDDNNVNVAGEEKGEVGCQKGNGDMGIPTTAKVKKAYGGSRRLGLLGAQLVDLRDVMLRRENRRREREFNREKLMLETEEKRGELELKRETQQSEREERLENWEIELEERHWMWAQKEFDRQKRVQREFQEERKRRRIMEEKREEEEMEWRERMVVMQIEHEKTMMQIHADACQNQMHSIGLMARFICQFFGANDALGGGLGGLPPQVLQNLQHPGGLDDNGKPDANSPSEFL